MNTERSTIRVAAAATAALLVLACAACTAGATALDRSGGQKDSTPATLALAAGDGDWEIGPYPDAVAQLSDGSMQVDVMPYAETEERFGVGTAEVIKAVGAGDVPLGLVTVRELGALGVSSLDPLIAPFVVDSLAMEAKLLQDEDLTASMLQGMDELGVEAVGILPGPLVHPFGNKHELLAASDFDGAVISASQGEVVERTLALLGSRFMVLESNGHRFDNTDGSLLPLSKVYGFNFHAPDRSVTADVALWPTPRVVVANRDAWAALTEQQRAVLRDAIQAAVPGVVGRLEQDDTDSAAGVCEVGLTFPEAGAADIDGLRAAVAPIVDEIGATETGAKVFARVEELRRTTPAQRPLECVPVPSHWPTEVSDRLDGIYVADTTPEDFRGEGLHEDAVAPEDWGHNVLVVKDGRYATTRENDRACTWEYGAWRMNDELVRETAEGGGGISPNWLVALPGQDFVWHWTDFGGTLSLTLATEDGPDDIAFTRVSDEPDVTALAHRCPPPTNSAFP